MAANADNVNSLVDSDIEGTAGAIDEDLQSRQLAVYGKESMKKLGSARIFISGMNGLGAEIAKNVILANVKRVVLHDTKNVTNADLAAQFYLTEADIGKNRATACAKKMQELNPSVRVKSAEGEITNLDSLKRFTTIVMVDAPLAQCIAIDNFCRAQNPPIFFIKTDVCGLFGRVFVDLSNFVCHDPTGESPRMAIVEHISNANPGFVKCIFEEEGRHDLQTGDKVIFSEVKGMTELNGQTHQVTVVNPYAFTIGDTSGLSKYQTGGIVVQVKPEAHLNYRSLADCQDAPLRMDPFGPDSMWFESDYAKFGRPAELHIAFRALDAFVAKHGKYPEVNNAEQAADLIALARSINAAAPENFRAEPSDALLTKLAYGASAVLNPMAAIFGGMVGQEVVKASTSKFHPVYQYFYADSCECLPATWPLAAEEYTPRGNRYDANVQVFGKSFQDKVSKLSYFLVGAGALGCEFLKNFALMGLATDKEGLVTVTDDDRIERSNLSRQFLFRNHNVGQSKSGAAAAAVQVMNPQFNVRAMQERVSSSTEDIFNETFWNSLSGVCNALDNVQARLYVDERCVFFGKSLLESGTLGTKCNVQVVLPHLTENYGASVDPPEKEAPQCTIHNFPHNIDHCLVWARSEFVGHFETFPKDASNYIEKGDQYVDSLKAAGISGPEILQNLRGDETWGGGVSECLVAGRCANFNDCVAWARNKFELYCANMIKQLIFSFPQDAVNPETGKLFWLPPKRFPTPAAFNINDPGHIGFIIAAANMRAKICGIERPANSRDEAFIKSIVAGVVVPEFTPRKDVKIKVEESTAAPAEGAAPANATDGEIAGILARLPNAAELKAAKVQFYPDAFEKDDDTNFHVDFIQSLANLRARAYGIEEVDKLQAKLKAGRIIPAIATATAMVTGFVCLELWKTVAGHPLESFRNTFVNLALPLIAQSEPVPPKKVKSRVEKSIPDPNFPDYVEERNIVSIPEGHTAWDKVHVHGDLTLKEFVEHFKTTFNIKLESVAIGKAFVYSSSMRSHADRLDQKLKDLVEKIGKVTLGNKKYLIPACNFSDNEGREVDLPTIILHFA